MATRESLGRRPVDERSVAETLERWREDRSNKAIPVRIAAGERRGASAGGPAGYFTKGLLFSC